MFGWRNFRASASHFHLSLFQSLQERDANATDAVQTICIHFETCAFAVQPIIQVKVESTMKTAILHETTRSADKDTERYKENNQSLEKQIIVLSELNEKKNGHY